MCVCVCVCVCVCAAIRLTRKFALSPTPPCPFHRRNVSQTAEAVTSDATNSLPYAMTTHAWIQKNSPSPVDWRRNELVCIMGDIVEPKAEGRFTFVECTRL
jgi:hypothetical protein